jgi:isoquinoline 1-oxidoreductase beta subunit
MSAGTLTVGVAFGQSPVATSLHASSAHPPIVRSPHTHLAPNAWVTLGADESIVITFAQAEMGQGIMTTLPLGIAEELDADWSQVRVVQSPTDGKTYGVNGTISTFGSTTVQTHFEGMRLIGAQARKVLIACAAAHWRVPVATLTTEPGRVVHAATARSISYGALAATASLPDPLPVATREDLKPPTQFRYVGTTLPRVDVPSKVNGTAVYGLDVQPDGLLYAAMLRPPVQGETADAVDDTAARAVPGIVRVATLPGGVLLIGETVEATQRAKRALRVRWSNGAKARTYTTRAVISDYLQAAADPDATVATIREDGDARAAIAGSPRTLVADYVANHVAHLCMEPMNATAQVHDGRVEIWAGTQAPTKIQAAVAKLAELDPERIVVHSTLLGGGFGRRFEIDFALDAYFAARLMPGRPVKLIFSREDDLAVDPFRPLVAQRLAVGLDADGAITGWWHRVVGESYFARSLPAMMQKTGGKDALVAAGGEPQYKLPSYRSEYLRQDRGIAVGALRGVSSGYTMFAVESMIDEIAATTRRDPLAFRLDLLKDNPRAIRVLQLAAQRSGWGHRTPPAGHALGLAYSGDLKSFMAVVVEISLDKARHEIKVHDIWCAIDAGLAIQPVNLEAQVEGSLLFGMGVALFEQVTIARGVVQESNFGEYRVLRMSDLPQMHVEILSTDNPPTGVGEAGVPAIAPAIANALARLPGGQRVRSLPILPNLLKT